MLSLISGGGTAGRRSKCSVAGREGEGRMRMPMIVVGIGFRRTLVIREISRYLPNGTASEDDSAPGVRKCCRSIPVLYLSAAEFPGSVGIRGPWGRFGGPYVPVAGGKHAFDTPKHGPGRGRKGKKVGCLSP